MVLVTAVALASPAASRQTGCPRCGWKPPEAARTVVVRTVDELERAVETAGPRLTILVADGRYALRRMVHFAAPGVTLRGQSGNPSRVVLYGDGMELDQVGVALSIGAPDVTVADLTITNVSAHAIQVRGEAGASRFTLHNARLTDAGQQLLKGSLAPNGRFADDGLVACSEFSYTTHAPSNYTNGVDLMGVKGWLIRDNRFLRIRGPERDRWRSGPAIMAWAASEDTVVLRNTIVDSFRGIALGLGVGGATVTRNGQNSYDHLRGRVQNNIVFNLHAWADEAIEVNAGRDARIEHNTVLVEGATPWTIGVRFGSASARLVNNLLSKPPLARDGGQFAVEGNVTGATRAWFVSPGSMDFHLTLAGARAIDAGVLVSDLPLDFAQRPRMAGKAPDAGALESGSRPVK